MEHITKLLRTTGRTCKPDHLMPPGYAACDALLDSTFPLVSEQLPILGPQTPKHPADAIGYPKSLTTGCLYLDLCSILMLRRSSALPPYMVTVMSAPTYDENTMVKLGKAFVGLTNPVSKSGAIFITRNNCDWSLTVVCRVGSVVEASSVDACWSSLDEVVRYLGSDSANGKCLGVCHDEPDSDSAVILSSIRTIAWSIGSTSACSAMFKPITGLPTLHLLPIYMHPGSTYMRILSTKGTMSPVYDRGERQTGDTGLYNCMIRGSRTRTGRCWDCQCLYALATALEECPQPGPTSRDRVLPTSAHGMLDSTFTEMYMSSLNQ